MGEERPITPEQALLVGLAREYRFGRRSSSGASVSGTRPLIAHSAGGCPSGFISMVRISAATSREPA
jgi:hypothetical protein